MRRRAFRSVVLTGVTLTMIGCSAEEKAKKPALSVPEVESVSEASTEKNGSDEVIEAVSEDVKSSGGGESELQLVTDEVFFRTGTQYVFAVAKTVDVLGSELKEATDYDAIASRLYRDNSASIENIQAWASAVTAYSFIASKACSLFLAKEESKSMSAEEVSEWISERAFVDPARLNEAQAEAHLLAEEIEDKEQKKHASCMTLLMIANISF